MHEACPVGSDHSTICADYSAVSSGLFIPETRRDAIGIGDMFVALGQHHAVGVAPFGVDSSDDGESKPLKDAYALVEAIDEDLLSSRVYRGFHFPGSYAPDEEVILNVDQEQDEGCHAKYYAMRGRAEQIKDTTKELA